MGNPQIEQIDAITYRYPGDPFTAIFGGALGIRIVGANGEFTIPAGHVLTLHASTHTWEEDGEQKERTYYSLSVRTEEEFNGTDADDEYVRF